MKPLSLACCFALFLSARVSFAADEDAKDGKGPLYHVVAIKFKEGTSRDQMKQVDDAFAALKTEIHGIQSLHWGTNVSPEQRNHGFTHCFVLTFENAKDRDAYLVDPAHKAFGKVLGPVMADVLVIDFKARE